MMSEQKMISEVDHEIKPYFQPPSMQLDPQNLDPNSVALATNGVYEDGNDQIS